MSVFIFVVCFIECESSIELFPKCIQYNGLSTVQQCSVGDAISAFFPIATLVVEMGSRGGGAWRSIVDERCIWKLS